MAALCIDALAAVGVSAEPCGSCPGSVCAVDSGPFAAPPLPPSPPPSTPRRVCASFTASALRRYTTLMLPGRALGTSRRAIRLLARFSRDGLEARTRIELMRGSAITVTRWPASTCAPGAPRAESSSMRATETAMSVATALLTGTTSTSPVDGLSSVATMRAMRCRLAA